MKIVLITGATSGIGEACSKIFAENGYALILTGRRKDRLDHLEAHLKEQFAVETFLLDFDVQDKNEATKAFDSLPERWRQIDVLVNNAGLSRGLDPLQEGSVDDWEQMIDTNIKGLLYVSKTVSRWMVERNAGHIINLGSIAGKEVYPNGNVYCATKSAVDALSKGMRIDLVKHNIKVTAIHPGAVNTEFSTVRFKGDTARADKVYEGFTPLLAEDVAESIWWVASRPAHVNINDLVIMPTAQASATIFNKS